MPALSTPEFSIVRFLDEEREKDLLRFSTAGSVDDGKSTLIGRLLYDTQSVYEDQVRSIEGKGTTAPGQIDFALLTDGLRAEREQGITIDVAYRYFSTSRRKFIIADTPGHEQYTRNMATGASTADASVVLIDAGKGVLLQSRRHAFIASLLRVRHIVVAVNKMDLIGYDQQAYLAIEADFRRVLHQISGETQNPVEAIFVPVSALKGDNVVHHSSAMPWYQGPSLLQVLESLPPSHTRSDAPLRFPVQRVLRPDHTFRGFSGQIASGSVRPGDAISVQPSGRPAVISRIVTWEGDLEQGQAPLSVTLVLDREIDISRGDVIVPADSAPVVSRSADAFVVWMNQKPLVIGKKYLLKHTSQTVPAVIAAIDFRYDIPTLSREVATELALNDIGGVRINLLRPLALDRYSDSRATGAFILIDPDTNATIAAGMVTEAFPQDSHHAAPQDGLWGPVSAGEREARWGHRGSLIELDGPPEIIDAIERSLFSIGAITARVEPDRDTFLLHPTLLETLIQLQTKAGFLSLLIRNSQNDRLTVIAGEHSISISVTEPLHVIAAVHELLTMASIFIPSEKAGL